jgi:uncharacterized protein (DUF4415 family)
MTHSSKTRWREAAAAAQRRADAMTAAEEARIQAGIAADPDNPELTDEDFARMRPASEVLPPELYQRLVNKGGRPKAAVTKVAISLRVDPDILAAYKAGGPGWQTRMVEVLREGTKRRKRA